MKILKLFFLFAFFSQILPAQIGTESKLKSIILAEAFLKPMKVPLSKFIDDITFIPLETNSKALIGGSVHYEISKEFIIVKQFRTDQTSQILLFDKNTGKFIREISKQGNGPGEYFHFGWIPFNPIKKEIYAQNGSREILIFDLSGKNTDKINTKTPSKIDDEEKIIDLSTTGISFVSMLDNETFVGYVRNISGKENKKIILFSKQGIIKIFPNYMTWDQPGHQLMLGQSGISYFYRWDKKLYFFENFCDTLYQVTKDLLIPRYYFDWGNHKIPYSKQGEISRSFSLLHSSIFIKQIDENKNYIFITVTYDDQNYLGYIDKKNASITFCKPGSLGISTFKDDIYGLLETLPEDITEENEMIFIIESISLTKWFKENPEMASQLKKKEPLLNYIDEFSNPIIAIGKCK